MKFFIVLIFGSFLVIDTQAQSLPEKIAITACTYLDSINDFSVLQDSITGSVIAGMSKVVMEGSLDEQKQIGTVEEIRAAMQEAVAVLPMYCYNVRRLMIVDKKNTFYKMSDSPLANEDYGKGNVFLESGDYRNAQKAFGAAIKLDRNFVYAIDNLAISYRRQGDFKTAIKHYKQSLEIFPEGDVALLNIAVCYSLLKDDDSSLTYYEQLKFLYPDNPEGYFGSAKILLFKSNYEEALDNLFIAHRHYVATNSAYEKDSQKLINIVFAKLKEINKTDLFKAKADEHSIVVDEP